MDFRVLLILLLLAVTAFAETYPGINLNASGPVALPGETALPGQNALPGQTGMPGQAQPAMDPGTLGELAILSDMLTPGPTPVPRLNIGGPAPAPTPGPPPPATLGSTISNCPSACGPDMKCFESCVVSAEQMFLGSSAPQMPSNNNDDSIIPLLLMLNNNH